MHPDLRVVKALSEDILLDRSLAQNSYALLHELSSDERALSYAVKKEHGWLISKDKKLDDTTELLNEIVDETMKVIKTKPRCVVAERLSYLVNTTVENEVENHEFILHPFLDQDEQIYTETPLIKAYRGTLFIPRLPWIYIVDKDSAKYRGKNLVDGKEVEIDKKEDSKFHYYEVVVVN